MQGIYPTLQRETSVSLLFPVQSSGGVGANSIKHECLHVYMYTYMVYMYFRRQFEAVPAYTDVTTVAQNTSMKMPVKDAPRIDLLSQL